MCDIVALEQRWAHERDRGKLIDSILRNSPVPTIFLYRREDDVRVIYDVIDHIDPYSKRGRTKH